MRLLPLVITLAACQPAQAAPHAATPAPQPQATTPCRLADHDLEKVDLVLWTAVENHEGSVGTCRIERGAQEMTYEVHDDKRLVAVLSPCGIDVRVPGITVDHGVGVGTSMAEVAHHFGVKQLDCTAYDRGTECWLHEDDGLDPVVRYLVDAKPPALHATVLAVEAATRCD